MASRFYAGMKNVVQALNEMWDAFAAGPFNALPLTGGTLTGGVVAPSFAAVREPTDSFVLGAGSGWFRIARLRLPAPVFGPDITIRVAGTIAYDAVSDQSNGAITTILARVGNDQKISGSFHTEATREAGTPNDVRFGPDGSVYILIGEYQRLSVYMDACTGSWTPQKIEYLEVIPTGTTAAVRSWGLRLGNPGINNLLIDGTYLTTGCTVRARGVMPLLDNAYDVGSAALAYRTIYARTGTINTSDARLKTDFRDLTPAEIAAARDIVRAIGIYRWRDAVEEKGDQAREHVGPTVQRAIEIMQTHGLDPFNYGFICHDTWERETVEHPAVEARPAVLAVEAIPVEMDALGNLVTPAVPARPGYPAIEARAAYTEVVLEAGDRYAFRYDELAMFIAAGQEARLAALEAVA